MNSRPASRRTRRGFALRSLAPCALALVAAVAFSSVGGRAVVVIPGVPPAAVAAAAITVNSTADATADDGQCTLREAIASATNDAPSGAAPGECAAGSGDDTITISATGTINLTGMLTIASTNMSIIGPGSNLLTVRRDTGGEYRIFFINAATVSMSGMTITNGRVNVGGGVGGGLINGGTTTLTDVVVTGNRTGNGFAGAPDGGHAGGINNSGILTMTDCVVSDNVTGDGVLGAAGSNGSGGRGGGIFNNGTLTMTDCTVSGNVTGNGPQSGGDGGGIFSGGIMTLTNVTVSNNRTGGGGFNQSHGGGIYFTSGTLTMTNTTVAANISSSGFGEGVYNSGTANVKNTIIARNGPGGTGRDASGTFGSQGNNLVGNASDSTGFTAAGDQVGTATTPLDPLLAPLANYGGPTQIHALLPGSPAIDAGTSTGAPAQDQRGVNRVGAVDIGSFESRGFNIAATLGTPQSTTIKTTFGAQLTATVSSAFGEPVAGGRVTFTAPAAGASGTFAGGATTASVTIDAGGAATAPTSPPTPSPAATT